LKKLVALAFPIAVLLACSSLTQKWETVSEDGITVEMPGKPTKQAQDVPSPAGKATGQMFTLDKGSEAYILAYHEFPESISNLNIDPKVLLKGASDGAVKNIDGKVTTERALHLRADVSGQRETTGFLSQGHSEGFHTITALALDGLSRRRSTSRQSRIPQVEASL